MFTGFKLQHLNSVQCPEDGGSLYPAHAQSSVGDAITEGEFACRSCEKRFPVRQGILVLVAEQLSNPESSMEQQERNRQALTDDLEWESSQWSRAEMIPSLEALEPLGGCTVLELGAGCGRYTTQIVKHAAHVLAVDFSFNSLCRISARLSVDTISLVCADICRLRIAPGRFDRVFSTLTSNLPTHEQRKHLYRLASQSLNESGRFVFSAHHYGMRERMRSAKKAGHYEEVSIFRQLFTRPELRAEVKPYFANCRCIPIQTYVPLSGRLGLPLLRTSQVASKIPLINTLGALLLATCTEPLVRRQIDC